VVRPRGAARSWEMDPPFEGRADRPCCTALAAEQDTPGENRSSSRSSPSPRVDEPVGFRWPLRVSAPSRAGRPWRSGKGEPARLLGRRLRYKPEDVAAWLDSITVS
jgi:hypothetical protein